MARTEICRYVFDLDGTLLDARGRQVGVAREALAEVAGADLDVPRFWRAKRAGATTRDALVALGHPAPAAEAAARRWGERIEDDDWLERDRALGGVRRTLLSVRASGAPIIVLTARRRAEGAQRSLRASGLAALVDDLIVVDPASAVRAKAAELRRCGAELFIGDTESDGAAAEGAAVPFAAVATGQRSRSYLERRGYAVYDRLAAAANGRRRPLGTRFATTPRTGALRPES